MAPQEHRKIDGGPGDSRRGDPHFGSCQAIWLEVREAESGNISHTLHDTIVPPRRHLKTSPVASGRLMSASVRLVSFPPQVLHGAEFAVGYSRWTTEGRPMAKKGSGKQQRPSQSRVTAEDRERYGDVIDVFTSKFGEYELNVAADMSGWDPARKAMIGVSLLALVGIIAGLMPAERNYPLVGISFAAAIISTVVSGKWSDLMKDRLRRTNLGQQVADGTQRVVVCRDALHVEHGDVVEDLPLSEVRNVTTDVEAALASFSGKRMLYVPRKALGETRFKAIVELLKG